MISLVSAKKGLAWGRILYCAFYFTRLSAATLGGHDKVEKIAVERGQVTAVGAPAEQDATQLFAYKSILSNNRSIVRPRSSNPAKYNSVSGLHGTTLGRKTSGVGEKGVG